MGWSQPRDWVTDEVVTEAMMDTHVKDNLNYLKTESVARDGTVALTADWDIGDGRMIQADKIRARDGAGLALYEDGGEGIFVADGGGVCVGTETASGRLRVVESGTSLVVRLDTFSTTAGDEPAINFLKSASATIGVYSETADGEDLAIIRFIGVNASSNAVSAAYILAEQDGAAGADRLPGRIGFYTGTDVASPTLRMMINSDGNIVLSGTIDGVEMDDHDGRHERGGADEIDGDHLDIDFTPTGYTPATTPAEAAHVDDLAAHLYGLDQWVISYKVGELYLSASSGQPSTTNGCAPAGNTEYPTNDVDIRTLDFDTGSDEFAQWTVPMPHNWNGGTVTGKFFWTYGAGGSASETVEWDLQGRAYANDDALDQAWGAVQTAVDTAIAQGDVHISPTTAAITLAGSPAAGQLVQFRAYRDVSGDTLACDARLIGILVTYGKS